jgi:hypothetical protein
MKIIKRYVAGRRTQEAVLIVFRYSEFEDLRKKLVRTFPHAAGSLPPLPPKSIVCKSSFRPILGRLTPLALSDHVRY